MLAFQRELERRSCSRWEALPWGTAIFAEELPRVWDLNLVRVEGARAGLDATTVAQTAERLQGAAGLTHRAVHVEDDVLGARLEPELAAAGFKVTRLVPMARRVGTPAPGAPATGLVREVDPATTAPARAALAAEAHGEDPRTIEQLERANGARAAALPARELAALVDGRVAALATMHLDGRTAEIDDVATLPEFRGRGLARAVVLAALATAEASGHDLTFLVADDDDWPKAFYARLGFAPIGRARRFVRPEAPAA